MAQPLYFEKPHNIPGSKNQWGRVGHNLVLRHLRSAWRKTCKKTRVYNSGLFMSLRYSIYPIFRTGR